ncbi:hypothetical protein V6Z11_D08G204000 [Gossypium hirsutum]
MKVKGQRYISSRLVVERMLASEGIKRVELGRDEFEKRVWEWKENKIDMTTTVLGFKISMPIMITPTAMQKMAHPEEQICIRMISRCEGVNKIFLT